MTPRYRLRLGLAGLGFIGHHQLRAARSVLSPRMNVDCCFPETVDQKRFEPIGKPEARRVGFEDDHIHKSLALLLKEQPDGVIIASRNNQHREHAEACMAAGVAVASEKPLADTLKNADAMLEAGRRFGIEKTCVLPSYTGHAAHIEARDVVQNQKKNAKKLRHGRAAYNQMWLAKLLADMAAAEGHDLAEWRKDPKQSGKAGVAGDLIAHLLHQLIFMLDMKIVEARAERRWFVEGKESGMTEDTCFGEIRFENDAIVQLTALQWGMGNLNNNHWELMFDDLTLGWNQREPEILRYADSPDMVEKNRAGFKTPLLGATDSMPAFHSDGWVDADGRLLNSWAWALGDCMPEGAELFHPTFLDGRNVVSVVDRLVASSEDGGKWKKVDWVSA